MNETKAPENRAYKVTLILLLGLAAFSTATKELNRLHDMVSSVQELTSQWRGSDLLTLKENPSSTQETISTNQACPNDNADPINSSANSGSSDDIALATDDIALATVEKIDCETFSEPELGAKVDLIAGNRANRNMPALVRAKYAPLRIPKQEISLVQQASKWPVRFEYKTLDRRVTLNLPLTMVTDMKGDALETEVSPAFVLGLLGKLDRKQTHIKTETRRRELMIKRFERINSSRRAS